MSNVIPDKETKIMLPKPPDIADKPLTRNVLIIAMFLFGLAVFLIVITINMCAPASFIQNSNGNEVLNYDFPFINRAQWNARTAQQKLSLPSPVPYVVIHHSYQPAACYDRTQCCKAMRGMQNYHMDDRNWWDIGYHFAVGSDGVAYEGRGWGVLGAHALHFNNVSIGICLIGDWSNAVPPSEQMKTTQALIASGVEMGYVKQNYKLVGHRQVRDTECPGDALYSEIQSWPHFSSFPNSYKDLHQVTELSGSG